MRDRKLVSDWYNNDGGLLKISKALLGEHVISNCVTQFYYSVTCGKPRLVTRLVVPFMLCFKARPYISITRTT